jgi:hypothetical protein
LEWKNPEQFFCSDNIFRKFLRKFFPAREIFLENILAGYLDHEPIEESRDRPTNLPWQYFTSEENTHPESKGGEGE